MKSKQDEQQYWTQRYFDQSTGWDLGQVSIPLKEYIDQLTDTSIKILIPGAGNAYEAEYLFNKGFNNVFIIDISEVPLDNFKSRNPTFPVSQIIHGDFFSLQDSFDLILEQTFFCSFPPVNGNRQKYTLKMHELLVENGKLVGVWFNLPLTGDLTKRPFGGTKEEYVHILKEGFEIEIFENCYNSMPDRNGIEFFGLLTKRV